ncbi:hypothetical protein D7V83_10990 [bacterium 0.1xD8-71]|nr:hypothetical protein D7V83_10990 [bacterium 0.1xD8-71]
MLGKLMKYEWKATWKFILIANLMITVMTIMANVTVKLDFFSYEQPNVIQFIAIMVMMTYILSMFAMIIGVAIFLVYRFYTSTYSDQGYLLHTLPVDKHHIIIAKVLVSALWIILCEFIMYLSVIILVAANGEVFETLKDGMDSIISITISETATVRGFAVVMSLVAFLFSLFAKLLKVTACISLGQLSANHKLLVSILYYFGIYIVQQILGVIYLAFIAAINKNNSFYDMYGWESMLVSGIVYSVVFYLITWYVMDKKLNLE